MKKLLYPFLILFSTIGLLYPQTTISQSDSLIKTEKDTVIFNAEEKVKNLESVIDSLMAMQGSHVTRIALLEEKTSSFSDKFILAYAAGGLGLLFSLIALVYTASKTRKLKDRIYAMSNRRDIDDLERKYLENKKRINESVDDLSGRYNTFYAEFCKAKDVLVNEITALSMKFDLSTPLAKKIEATAMKQESVLIKQADKEIPGKPKTFLVEYFVDNGEIKFKETNSGTPFYMDVYEDRSELTVNESTYAPSNYSESIQKCFRVNGDMSGKYRNKIPALCSFDSNLNVWNLIQMGELDAL
jgi:hypothetical protein